MTDVEETARRSFVVAYAKEYVEKLEERCERFAPPDCNWIDPETLMYVCRPDKHDTNFRSWTAYHLWSLGTHMYVTRDPVLSRYYLEVEQYNFCDEDIESVLYRWGDPFSRLMDSWFDDFEMCLYELLLE